MEKRAVHEALLADPATRGLDVRNIASCDGAVSVRLAVAPGAPREQRDALTRAARVAIYRHAAELGARVDQLNFEFIEDANAKDSAKAGANPGAPAPPPAPSPPGRGSPGAAGRGEGMPSPPAPNTAPPLPGVRRIIAVGAGKGGVGKSTIAVNLAVGLARKGRAVGILDGDIYGPSLPTMLGLANYDPVTTGGMLQPFYIHGVKAVTIGKLVEPEKPLIWRGPMAHGAFKQLATQTQWGDLDDLIIDLPPGTGDVSLTLAQTLPLTGAVVVCTPQKVAQDDAVRAVRMFQQLSIDVLGVVENMSFFVGDDRKEYDIFGRGGAEKMAQRLGVPFLGAVPITMALRQNSDRGEPSKNFEKGGALAESLEAVVDALHEQAAHAATRRESAAPTITVR